MRNQALEVSPRNYIRAMRALKDSGITADSLLGKSDINVKELLDPKVKVPFKFIDRQIQRLHQYDSYNPNYPYRIGTFISINRESVLFKDNGNSVSIDNIFRSFAIYYKLISPALNYNYFSGTDSIIFSVKLQATSSKTTANFHFSYISSAIYWSLFDILAGDVPAFYIYLPMEFKSFGEYYERLGKARCTYIDMAETELRIEFPKGIALNIPRNFDIHHQNESQFYSNVASAIPEVRGLISDWVYTMLEESHGELLTLTNLASSLNLSIRTIERYLKKEGTRFRKLSLQVKNEQALLLLNEGQEVACIAHQLGYSCPRSFSRTFQNYNGITPSEYKAMLAASATSR